MKLFNCTIRKLLLCYFVAAFNLVGSAQEEGLVKDKDSKIYYRTFGTGKPLIIINGGPGFNSNGFRYLATKLSKNNKTIIYDQRGTGKSTVEKIDSSTITMKLMVEDLERLRNHLKIDKWIILGHSFGGMLACYYTVFHPDKIEALILSSSGGVDLELQSYLTKNINSRLSPEELDSARYWTTKINQGDTSFYARRQRGKLLAAAYIYDKKNTPIIAERLAEVNSEINRLVWQDLQKIKFDCTEKLSSFTRPVLIIQGKQDIIEEKTALKEHRIFKNSQLVFLEKCVHYGWLDRPDQYFEEIGKFVRSQIK